MNAKERIAYLKGLLDFMPAEEKQTKVYSAIVDALDALADELDDHTRQFELYREDCNDLAEEMDDLQEAFYELERSVGVDADDDFEDDEDEEDDDAPTESYVSVTCPACSYSFYSKCDDDEGRSVKFVCPNCGEEFERQV